MKLFQNRFFLICISIALVITAVTSTFSLMGYHGLAREVIGTVTVPFRWCLTKIGDGFEGIGDYFRLKSGLLRENEELSEENESLRSENARAELLEAENARLRRYLGMKTTYPSFLLEEGMVISAESSNYVTVLTLNRGTMHGVNVNMPVITENGVVGYVTEAGFNWCKVCTILETATNVGAYVARSGASGIVKGDYSLRYDGLCRMTFLDANADVQVGDRILSSGNGSVYPADLVIGDVVELSLDKNSRTLVATVRPAADLSDPGWMMIITGYDETGDVPEYHKPVQPVKEEETTGGEADTGVETDPSTGGFG